MILLPLEEREFAEEEHFQTSLILDERKTYEMAVMNCFFAAKPPRGIATVYCSIVDPSMSNPDKILFRFSLFSKNQEPEFYIIDTYNLRSFSLKIAGLKLTSPISVTLGIREKI